MSPDIYLGFTALFISYFLKVAVACLLCWVLTALLKGPGQRFNIWLGFVLGALTYWFYSVVAFSFSAAEGGATAPAVSRISHEFLVSARFQSATLMFGRILGSAYVLGVLLLVAVGIWKRIWLRLLLRKGSAASDRLQYLFSEMRRQFAIRHCELSVLSSANSPATVYWWRPRIVLPRICEQVGDEVLMADILSHELAHVSRRDYLWSAISDVACALLFFHPAVWQARRQMRRHREMACDLAVVSGRPEHRADYAQTLTRVARMCLPRKRPAVGVDFAAAPSLLRHRVEAILRESDEASAAGKASRALAAAALVGCYGLLCSMMAVAIAFAPLDRPGNLPAMASQTPHPVSAAAHRVKRSHPQVEEQGLITESPAYRLPSNSRSEEYAVDSPVRAREHDAAFESSAAAGSFPTGPASGRTPSSVGTTVESVVVATVGTVLSSDKDDHSSTTNTTKRK